MSEEKTWNMVYDSIMDLTKAVNDLRSEMRSEIGSLRTEISDLRSEVSDLRVDMNTRFDLLEGDNQFAKVKLFDFEKQLNDVKRRA